MRRTYLGRRSEGPGQVPLGPQHGRAALGLGEEPRRVVPVGQAEIQGERRKEGTAGVRGVVARHGGVAQVAQSAPAELKY